MDLVLAAGTTVVALTMLVLLENQAGLSQAVGPVAASPHSIWWHAAPLAIAARTAPLAIRRVRPLTAFWLCLAVCALVGLDGTSQFGLPVSSVVNLVVLAPAAYSAVVHSPYRVPAILSLPVAVFVLAFPGIAPPQSGNYTLLTELLLFASVLTTGNAVRLSRRRASQSQDRLARLQAGQEEATRQAIGHERARIASDLHDVVTHNVSMMVVLAGAARGALATYPEDTRSALAAIEESGRAAITELQHMLGLLAPAGQHDGSSLTGIPDSGPLQPQPGIDRLRPLIDRVAAVGVQVELRVRGTPRQLPAGMDLAAYRVIQEALTNVIKHAGQPRTTVTLDYHDDGLTIEVADDGRPSAVTAPTAHQGAAGNLSKVPEGGRGLLGLRERVLVYGGELDAGRRPGGGWLVRALIPQEQAPSAPTTSCSAAL